MLSITEAKANTPDPACTVTFAYPRSIADCPALFKNGSVSCFHSSGFSVTVSSVSLNQLLLSALARFGGVGHRSYLQVSVRISTTTAVSASACGWKQTWMRVFPRVSDSGIGYSISSNSVG
jgi:hypothetical protein